MLRWCLASVFTHEGMFLCAQGRLSCWAANIADDGCILHEDASIDWTMQYLLLYNRFSASHLVSALGSNVSLAVLC